MAAEHSERGRDIAEARGVTESAVFEAALDRWPEKLWEDVMLQRSFVGNLFRAVEPADVFVGAVQPAAASCTRDGTGIQPSL